MSDERIGGWNEGRAFFRLPAWTSGVLLVTSLILGAWVGWLTHRDTRDIERNNAFALRLEHLLSVMKDLETGQRGFLLTGADAYLDPYTQAQTELDGSLEAVRDLGFPLGSLPGDVENRRQSAKAGIGIMQTQGQVAAVEAVKSGKGRA